MMRITKKIMPKYFFILFALLFVPGVSSAHETRMYEINGIEYEIVVGSLGEPVLVDDKTGVSLEIVRDGVFFIGAQNTLKVEMIAGEKSRIVDLSPVHGQEGQYKAPFIATIPTTLTYRVFGTLEETAVDLSFTCNPAGHPRSEPDATRTPLSEGVDQILKKGAFGCPQPKEGFGFPEPAPSENSITNDITVLKNSVEKVEGKTAHSKKLALVALVLSVISIVLWVFARRKIMV